MELSPYISDLWSAWNERPVSHQLAALASCGVIFLAAKWYLSRQKLPPGPPALPLIGSLPWMRGDLRDKMLKMSARYGPVFTVYFGRQPTIIVADNKLIREALLKHGPALIDRPEDSLVSFSKGENRKISKALGLQADDNYGAVKGVLEVGGEIWKEQRAFIHTAFRQFGIGTAQFEPVILEECRHLIDLLLHEAQSGPVNLQWPVMKAVANLIWALLHGQRREYDDPKYVAYLKNTKRGFEIIGAVGLVSVFPFLKYLPGDPVGWSNFVDMIADQLADFKSDLEDAKRNREPGVPRSFVDAYLDHVEKCKDDPNTSFNEQRLIATIGNLFGGGSDTNTTTLLWAVIFLLHHPDVYRKVQAEVDEIVGGGTVSMRYKTDLPYTEATLLEIQRMADVIPLNPPRLASEDIQLGDQVIPKGHSVILLFHAVHRDAQVWEDPYVFRPERFLDDNGQVYGRDRILPFSLGKRNCLGESMAKMELFLFFTSFIQQLEFSLPEGSSLPELVGKQGLTYAPKSYQVCIKSRAR